MVSKAVDARAQMRGSIVFFSTAWGTRMGGVNSFNFDICAALAAKTSARVICVARDVSEADRQDAAQKRVYLLGLSASQDDFEQGDQAVAEMAMRELGQAGLLPVSWWVGHDYITGMLARRCAEIAKSGKFAVFHHMDLASYKVFQTSANEAQQRAVDQAELLRSAGLILAVGPKLRRSAEDIARRPGGPTVVEVIPGLTDCSPLSLPPSRFCGFVSGRISERTDAVKQATLAVDAISSLIHRGSVGLDPRLYIYGVDENFVSSLNAHAVERSKRKFALYALPFTEDRPAMLQHLTESTLAIMPSLHEGFGLVAWDAISAGVPLVISRNSGAYEYLERCGEDYIGLVWAVDITGSEGDTDREHVELAAQEIAAEPKRAKEKATRLRKLLVARECTWENAAKVVRTVLSLPSREEGIDVELSVQCKDFEMPGDEGAWTAVVVGVVSDKVDFQTRFVALERQLSRDPLLTRSVRERIENEGLNPDVDEPYIQSIVMRNLGAFPIRFYVDLFRAPRKDSTFGAIERAAMQNIEARLRTKRFSVRGIHIGKSLFEKELANVCVDAISARVIGTDRPSVETSKSRRDANRSIAVLASYYISALLRVRAGAWGNLGISEATVVLPITRLIRDHQTGAEFKSGTPALPWMID